MKALVVYDSVYGNTEKIAKSIGDAITGDTKVLRAGEVNLSELESVDLLIVGAPTQGGRPTPPVQEFLKTMTESSIKGVKIAAFDTRISQKWVGTGRLAFSKKGDPESDRRRVNPHSPLGRRLHVTPGDYTRYP